MTSHPYLDHGLSILRAKMQPPRPDSLNPWLTPICPFVTLSRECGAGATTLGEYLVPLLDQQLGGEDQTWLFLDKNLLTHALSQDHLPGNLAQFLPEDRQPEIQSLVGEIVGLHPPIWDLEHRVAEAILHIAQLGCVILAGRGSHLITRSLPGGLHVRLVAPLATRIHRIQLAKQCDQVTAAGFVHENDRARSRFVQANFGADIDDPHSYDLVINTEEISTRSAAELVIRALQARVESLAHTAG